MVDDRMQVGFASTAHIRDVYIDDADLEHLQGFADFHFAAFEEPFSWTEPPTASPETEASFSEFVRGLDALVLGPGAPRIGESVFAAADRLKLVGELEGDRFAMLIDVEAAARHGVVAVDTTQGSSFPTAEWALGLILVGLRNAGAHFRALINHEEPMGARGLGERFEDPGFIYGELTGKTVGLIGAGHVGRKLMEYMRPFDVDVLAYVTPSHPRELPDACDYEVTSLDNVMALSDVVVASLPDTPATRGILGAHEFSLLRPGAVFVNVGRGVTVDSEALIERLRKGDVVAALDVWDPEPFPVDSPVRGMKNVFLTPHIAGVTLASRTRFFNLMVGEIERVHHGFRTRYDLTPRTMAGRRGESVQPA